LSNGIVKDPKNAYLQYLRVYLDIKVNGEKATVLQSIADKKDVQQAVCYILFVNDMDMLKFVRRDTSVANSLTDQLMLLLSSSRELRDDVFGRMLRSVDSDPLVKAMLQSVSSEQMYQLLDYRLGYNKLSNEGKDAELRGYREMQDFSNISEKSAKKLEVVLFSDDGYSNVRNDILSADKEKRDSAAGSLIKLSSKTNNIDRVIGVLDRMWLDSAEPARKGCDVTALRKATHACFKQKHKDSILPWWMHYAAYSIKWAFTPSAKLRTQALHASRVRSSESGRLLTKNRTAGTTKSAEVSAIEAGKRSHEREFAAIPRTADRSVATSSTRVNVYPDPVPVGVVPPTVPTARHH
jgi:hypothetical protein